MLVALSYSALKTNTRKIRNHICKLLQVFTAHICAVSITRGHRQLSLFSLLLHWTNALSSMQYDSPERTERHQAALELGMSISLTCYIKPLNETSKRLVNL